MLKSHVKYIRDTPSPLPRTPECLQVLKDPTKVRTTGASPLQVFCKKKKKKRAKAARLHQSKCFVCSGAHWFGLFKPRDWPQPRGPGQPHSQSSTSQSQSSMQTLSRGNSADVLIRPEVKSRTSEQSPCHGGGSAGWGAGEGAAGEGLVRVQGR